MKEEIIKNLTDKILKSKKYHFIYKPTIERIVLDILGKYPEKQAEKEIKRKLHYIWGAYFTRPNFKKLIKRIENDIKGGKEAKEIVLPLLKLQTSTNERIPILDNFYQEIFSITGIPKKIIEPACGINALTYFWMNEDIEYLGYDVDLELIDFLNNVFTLLNVKNKAKVELGDILIDKTKESDVVLLLKVLSLLERQKKESSLNVLKKLKSKYIIVSYPIKSISGREKGMKEFYEKQFMELVKNQNWKIERIIFETELVFVIKK